MNRFLYLALFLCHTINISIAQGVGYQNCIQVISASGKTATQGGLTFSYTVGEPMITTLIGNTRIVTQGFHQPELCKVVSSASPVLEAWNVEVFPNPTSGFLTVSYAENQGRELHATVYNLFGQVMIDDYTLNRPEGVSLDCSNWQSGVYILQLKDPATLSVGAVRFIRL